jgi:hypothetical protein
MSCDVYRAYRMEELDAAAFADHVRSCGECAERLELDRRIEDEARALPAPTSAPGLWRRIAADLEPRAPWPVRAARWLDPGRAPWWRPVGLGAAAAIVVAVGVLRPFDPHPAPTNLLSERAVAKVERLEGEYEAAIRELEAATELAALDTDVELRLRYRDRLETIDAQIRRCKAILAQDRANAHVRRSLLAAYEDKKETLIAMLALTES